MKTQNVNLASLQSAKPPTPEKLLAKADQDGDGKLSVTEWQTITDKISLHHSAALNANELLQQYDEDDDGALNETEVKNALTGIADSLGIAPPPPPPTADEIFTQADQDEDSLLSLDEWQTVIDEMTQNRDVTISAEEWLERFDEDGDGNLNQTEAKTAIEALMAELAPPAADDAHAAIDRRVGAQLKTYAENANLGKE